MKINKPGSLITRLLFYIGGMFLVALGVRVAVRGGLGISPVSSPSRSIFNMIQVHDWSLELFGKHIGITYGMCSAAVFIFFILLQVIVLRRDFKPINLLQILVSTVFGFFVDLAGSVVALIPTPEVLPYPLRLVFLACSILLIAVGLIFYLGAKLLPMPSEGICLAIQSRLKDVPYHKVKVAADCACVLSAIAIVWFSTHTLTDIREGTLITAVMAGVVMGWLKPVLHPFLKKCGMEPA
ncbi:MAG: DUF6198 family protein [Oscillospiraceae bacterium]|jgi:uncharacterized membrane protein YczE|nr:DUF6198 family protein [Oscillospiraceae bacterium]